MSDSRACDYFGRFVLAPIRDVLLQEKVERIEELPACMRKGYERLLATQARRCRQETARD